MKKILLSTIFIFTLALSLPKTVAAGILKLDLSDLPSYQNTTNFALYYTYMETDDKTATVNLYLQKEGKDWRQTVEKNKTEVNGIFQIQGSDIYDGEGRYFFSATAITEDQTVNSEVVTTVLDMSPPGAPSEYGKERINSTTYKLTWKNPGDGDYKRVFVYRSKETSFTADSSTKVAEVGGAPDEKMTFNDGSVEADVTYYYALRAIDQAGNISGVVTDAPGTVVVGAVEGAQTLGTGGPLGSTGESGVSLLPKEGEESGEEGQLGGGISTEEGEVKGESDKKSPRLIYILGGIGLFLILGFWYFRRQKGKKELL